MIARRQLLVRHRGLDPTAWTALEALLRATGAGAASGLARAALWEFAWEDSAGEDLAAPLAEWVASANWFANPNRDRSTWRAVASQATDLEAGAALPSGGQGAAGAGAYLVTAWRSGAGAPGHAAAAGRALGRPIEVRRGEVWWLGAPGDRAAALLEQAGGGAAGGLLANPHSQRAVLYAGGLPVPALPEDPGREGRPAAGEGGK